MKNKLPLALTLCSAVITLPALAADAPLWKAIAFGQSTDVNFSSNVLPEKVGVNNVTIEGKTLSPDSTADLSKPITIESRGGKIANSHDGLTFFYTQLPTDENFVLKATVTVDQFGPENGAKPAAQEGAGLLVRDVIGTPRQEPLKEGYEEFPAAANMVMNAIMTQDKKDAHRVKLQAIAREGITQPWGNAGSAINKVSYKEEVDLQKTPTFRLKLERTNEGFVTAWAPAGSEEWVSEKLPRADLISVQDKQHYYVGFFASRNAKITVSDASLTTSSAQTVASAPFVAKSWPPVMQIASADKSLSKDYTLQARANGDGNFTVRHNEVVIGLDKAVKAGEMFTLPTQLHENNNFQIIWTPTNGKPVTQSMDVQLVTAITGNTLYVAPDGKAEGKGTQASPLDLNTAISLLPPGGKIILAAGSYPKTDIPLSASGLKDKPKALTANGKAVIHGMLLDANYWHLNGIDITDKSLRIQGSHNIIENVVAYRNDDTGIQISSPDKLGRPLWASYNRVVNSESFSNEDPGKINADGFAVKMRVGEGNRLEGCYSHDNIDDGYDLFNKIEDGANGVVVIENSIARNNTSNGFKLGGEGQPVAHEIRNSIAIGNHLDGFTDNFNPGKLVVVNNVAVDNQRFNFIFRPSPYGDASLTTSSAQTVASAPFVAKSWQPVMQIASADKSLSKDYTLQARANSDGNFTVRHNEVVIGLDKAVKAGEMFTLPTQLHENNNFQIIWTPTNGKPVTQSMDVQLVTTITGNTLYVAPDGKAEGKGTQSSPLDLNTAISLLPPGGTIILAAGSYPKTGIPLSASGLKDKLKTLTANGKAVIHGMLLDANYWHLNGIDITDKSLRIQGSHNIIENVVAYRNDDTGIQISSPDKLGRPLWASYNRVVNSESFSNEDPGKINADGFAVKMRVGEGNRLEGCYSHDNIDDGYDLFNKIEDGANGVVVIENSIARNNTSNGFKLGGEGQPVAHEIRNSIAIGNHLDGFTDNFNPGKLVVVNNVAVDNQRFNFIFRPSPYGDASTQGVFSDSLSLRTTPGKYDDAVVGNIDASNIFIAEGKSINSKEYLSLDLPQPLERNADGSFKTGDFLTKN